VFSLTVYFRGTQLPMVLSGDKADLMVTYNTLKSNELAIGGSITDGANFKYNLD